jgi:hypothetical protein
MKNHDNDQGDDEKAATALIMLAVKIAVGIAIIIGIASLFVK